MGRRADSKPVILRLEHGRARRSSELAGIEAAVAISIGSFEFNSDHVGMLVVIESAVPIGSVVRHSNN